MTQKPFQGFATFLKSPIYNISAKIAVLGLPFDGATSYRPGARFGPSRIREASMMLTDGWHPTLGVDPCQHVSDFGDVTVSNLDVARSLEQIESAILNHPFYGRDDKRFLLMGGDHTITTAALRALSTQQEEDIVVLHFDAHCDTWEDHFGDPLGHGTWVRNVVEERRVKAENIVQVGIRSPVDPATAGWLPSRGGTVITSREVESLGLRAAAGFVRNAVATRLKSHDQPVYVTFDIDSLDPAYAPGTGTPEIGGLTPGFALEVLESLRGLNVIGMDLVEVNPSYDPAGITALAGATMLWTMAGVMSA
jgi:agmatinase